MFGNNHPGSEIYGDTIFGGDNVGEFDPVWTNTTAGVLIRAQAVFSSFPGQPRIPALDIIINFRNEIQGAVPRLGIGAYGSFEDFGLESYVGMGLNVSALMKASLPVAYGPNRLGIRVTNNFSIDHPNENAVMWSKIGSLDFTLAGKDIGSSLAALFNIQVEDTTAGLMPLPWRGHVYAVKQLGTSDLIFVYGENGISVIQAHGEFYGEKYLSTLGLKSKHSIVMTEDEQYFILSNGILHKIATNGEIKKLGYDVQFNIMNDITMSYDNENNLIYICDGTTGYVYSIDDSSLGEGPGNVTGIQSQDGTSLVVAPDDVTIPRFEIQTDLYDFGIRKEKTLLNVEIGTDYIEAMQLQIEYRVERTSGWRKLPWVAFNPLGKVQIPCYGLDFRFKLRSSSNIIFSLDYIKINGIIHGFSPLDTTVIN